MAVRLAGLAMSLAVGACGSGDPAIEGTPPPEQPPPPPPPPPPPSPTVADPTLLPVANAQEPDKAAYSALNVPGLPAGGSYKDPVTGVTVYKVSSTSRPVANTGATHEYFEGGPYISGPGAPTATTTRLRFTCRSSRRPSW